MNRELAPQVCHECVTCTQTTWTPIEIIGNRELFCCLKCALIFYSQSNEKISRWRKEMA